MFPSGQNNALSQQASLTRVNEDNGRFVSALVVPLRIGLYKGGSTCTHNLACLVLDRIPWEGTESTGRNLPLLSWRFLVVGAGGGPVVVGKALRPVRDDPVNNLVEAVSAA